VTLTHYCGDTVSDAFTPEISVQNWAIRRLVWNYEGAKVSSSTANILALYGANATTVWPVTLGGAVLKIQLKTLKTGDTIMILFTPRY
jgi:hypothetical protein